MPLKSDQDMYFHHVSTVEKLKLEHLNREFIILGDFNLPKVNWVKDCDFTKSLFAECSHNSNLIRKNSTTLMNSFCFFDFK